MKIPFVKVKKEKKFVSVSFPISTLKIIVLVYFLSKQARLLRPVKVYFKNLVKKLTINLVIDELDCDSLMWEFFCFFFFSPIVISM